jgi:hypothetical protein
LFNISEDWLFTIEMENNSFCHDHTPFELVR